MDIGRELDYWSKTLGIPRTNFTKPYVKSSTRAGLTYKSFGHGTCNITYLNVQVKREIMQTISAISDFYANIDIILIGLRLRKNAKQNLHRMRRILVYVLVV